MYMDFISSEGFHKSFIHIYILYSYSCIIRFNCVHAFRAFIFAQFRTHYILIQFAPSIRECRGFGCIFPMFHSLSLNTYNNVNHKMINIPLNRTIAQDNSKNLVSLQIIFSTCLNITWWLWSDWMCIVSIWY